MTVAKQTRFSLLLLASLFFSPPVMAQEDSQVPAEVRPDMMNQSFSGETRGVDVTVLGSSDLIVNAMTLDGLNITNGESVPVEARIYESSDGKMMVSSIAKAQPGTDQSLTLPITATLTPDKSYRLSFFVPESDTGNTASGFTPKFPYTEAMGVFRVNQAYSITGNAFPTNLNILVPALSVTVTDEAGNESIVPLGSGRTFEAKVLPEEIDSGKQ